MPLKVLLVSPLPPPPGGIATWTKELLAQMEKDGAIEIVHINSAIRLRSATDLRHISRILAGLCYSAAMAARFIYALRFKRVDVVHLCTSGSFGLARDLVFALLSRSLKMPVVVHFRHGRIPQLARARNWEMRLVSAVCRVADHVLVLDKHSADSLSGLSLARAISVIPNAIWKVSEYPVSFNVSEQPVASIIFAGHITRAKGVPELVVACSQLADTQITLELIGPCRPEVLSELENLARPKLNGAWLRFTGVLSREQVLTKMNQAYLFVLPSHTEGFPNAILEAMVMGKPIVATRVGAIPEMLVPDDPDPCGICVPIGNIEQLMHAISELIKDPLRAARYGRNARKRALALYGADAILEKYKTLWFGLHRQSKGNTNSTNSSATPTAALVVHGPGLTQQIPSARFGLIQRG